jgi:hypothetical protein
LVSRMEFTKHFRLLARRGVEGNEAMSMTQNGTSSSNINSSETMPLMV